MNKLGNRPGSSSGKGKRQRQIMYICPGFKNSVTNSLHILSLAGSKLADVVSAVCQQTYRFSDTVHVSGEQASLSHMNRAREGRNLAVKVAAGNTGLGGGGCNSV
jgi:hypothetical protein